MNCCLALANSPASIAGSLSSAAIKPQHQRQVLLQALGANFQALRAHAEGDFGADVVELLRDGEFVERLGAAVQHHAGERRNRDVARSRHGIARRQRAHDDHHLLDAGLIGDEIDARGLRPMAVVGHAGPAARGRGEACG